MQAKGRRQGEQDIVAAVLRQAVSMDHAHSDPLLRGEPAYDQVAVELHLVAQGNPHATFDVQELDFLTRNLRKHDSPRTVGHKHPGFKAYGSTIARCTIGIQFLGIWDSTRSALVTYAGHSREAVFPALSLVAVARKECEKLSTLSGPKQ